MTDTSLCALLFRILQQKHNCPNTHLQGELFHTVFVPIIWAEGGSVSLRSPEGRGVSRTAIMMLKAGEGVGELLVLKTEALQGHEASDWKGCMAGAKQFLISVTWFPHNKWGYTHFCPIGWDCEEYIWYPWKSTCLFGHTGWMLQGEKVSEHLSGESSSPTLCPTLPGRSLLKGIIFPTEHDTWWVVLVPLSLISYWLGWR